MVGYNYSGGTTVTLWLDGSKQTCSISTALNTVSGSVYVGSNPGGAGFNGQIANVQMYNSSLTQNEVEALYLEGIGGAPIKLQNLLAWWPLNGNFDDYSGKNDNGALTGTSASFNSTWSSQYTAP